MLRMLHDMSYHRTIVATITNTDDGTTVEVSHAAARYCVRMRDDDSGTLQGLQHDTLIPP